MSKSRTYLYTSYKLDRVINFDKVKYSIYSLEVCPSTGRQHHQGYIQFNNPVSLSTAQKFIGDNTAHLERPRGTPQDNISYCSKAPIEGPFIFGEEPHQGRRSDLQSVVDDIKKPLRQIAQDHPVQFIKYHRGIERLKEVLSCEDLVLPTLQFNIPYLSLDKSVLIYGDTSLGKTSFALSHFKNPLLVRHLDKLDSFDSIIHDGIVFDDMSFNHLPPTSVIHLLDQDFPSDIHIRYKIVHIPAHTKKIFTHNSFNPFYNLNVDLRQQEAIERRIFRFTQDAPFF